MQQLLRWFAVAAIGYALVVVLLGLFPSIEIYSASSSFNTLVETQRWDDTLTVLYLAALVAPGALVAHRPRFALAWSVYAIVLPIGSIAWAISNTPWFDGSDESLPSRLALFLDGSLFGLTLAIIGVPPLLALARQFTSAGRRAARGSRTSRSCGRANP